MLYRTFVWDTVSTAYILDISYDCIFIKKKNFRDLESHPTFLK
jgi:hypothetical protein